MDNSKEIILVFKGRLIISFFFICKQYIFPIEYIHKH